MKVTHGAAVRPYHGLTSCGDAAVHVQYKRRDRFVLVDALGHGPDAELTAQRLAVLVRETGDLEIAALLLRCDVALTGTTLRGAAMGVFDVQSDGGWFSGVGNIDVYGPKGAKRPVCRPGTLGRRVRDAPPFAVDLQPGSRWVMVSDGLRRRDLEAAMLATRALPPAAAAEAMIATAARPDDDASIWVLEIEALP